MLQTNDPPASGLLSTCQHPTVRDLIWKGHLVLRVVVSKEEGTWGAVTSLGLWSLIHSDLRVVSERALLSGPGAGGLWVPFWPQNLHKSYNFKRLNGAPFTYPGCQSSEIFCFMEGY